MMRILPFVFLFAIFGVSRTLQMMPGGTTDARKPDESEIQLAETFKNEVKDRLGSNAEWPVYKPIKVMTQVVAGTNYFFKVNVGNNEAVHLRIYKPLPYMNKSPELVAFCSKPFSEPLQYFDGRENGCSTVD